MKTHKTSYEEVNKPGSIWPVVGIAKRYHRDAMDYRKQGKWDMASHCLAKRSAMMESVRIIARGLLAATYRKAA